MISANFVASQLSSLADLATETSKVRSAQAAYLQDLVNIGVVGFRLDAAKSIPPDDLQAILGMVKVPSGKDPLFIIQEVEFGSGQPVTPQMYTKVSSYCFYKGITEIENFLFLYRLQNGNVIEFRTAFTLHQDFNSGISSLLSTIPGDGWTPATS